MMRLLLASLCLSMPILSHGQSGEFKLLCSAMIRDQKMAKVLNVNYSASTVDGRKAEITGDSIKWSTAENNEVQGRVVVYRHELNRIAGTYSSYGEGIFYAGPPVTYDCVKAPPA